MQLLESECNDFGHTYEPQATTVYMGDGESFALAASEIHWYEWKERQK